MCQTWMFSWISPLLHYGGKFDLSQKDIPKLADEDAPHLHFDRLKMNFERIKNIKLREGMALTKSLYLTFRRDIMLAIAVNFILSLIDLVPPILTGIIISYIEDKDGSESILQGLAYTASFLFTVILTHILNGQMYFQFGVLGNSLSNTLSLLIYEKTLKYPLASEKLFGVSDIINYSQVDSQRLNYMGYPLASALTLPFKLVAVLGLLYYYIGPSFLAGVVIMIIAMVITLLLNRYLIKVNAQVLIKKDGRMKIT